MVVTFVALGSFIVRVAFLHVIAVRVVVLRWGAVIVGIVVVPLTGVIAVVVMVSFAQRLCCHQWGALLDVVSQPVVVTCSVAYNDVRTLQLS